MRHLALGLLLATEVRITLAGFIVEDKVRRPLGGLLPGERATHTIMAIIYGAMNPDGPWTTADPKPADGPG